MEYLTQSQLDNLSLKTPVWDRKRNFKSHSIFTRFEDFCTEWK